MKRQEEKGEALETVDGWTKKKHDQQRPQRIMFREHRIVPEQNFLEMKDPWGTVEKTSIKK